MRGRNVRRAKRVAFVLLAALLATAALLAIAVLLLTRTQWGMQRVGGGIEALVNGQIPGRLSIETVERVDQRGLAATGVVFHDPDGMRVIRLEELEIGIDLGAALGGDIVLIRPRVRGGTVWIHERVDGSTRIERAFDDGKGSQSGGSSNPLIAVRKLALADIDVVVKPKSGDKIVISGVTGELDIERPPSRGVMLELSGIEGRVTKGTGPFGEIALKRLQGKVQGGARHVMHLEAQSAWNGERAKGYVDYYDREEQPVEIHLDKEGFSIADVMVWARNTFTDSSTVSIEVGKP